MPRTRVGRSDRTPAKHALMNAIVGREAGAANTFRMRDITRLLWLDLTAGDALVPDDADGGWKRNCSPGILAYHAIWSRKPVVVILHEKNELTFRTLEKTLAEKLPDLGYAWNSSGFWEGGCARAYLVLGDGAEVAVHHLIDQRTAVLAINDPNSIVSWAMRPSMAAEIAQQTSWFRSISTMGCNVGGQKNRFSHEERVDWFRHVDRQIEVLPRYRDALLVAIERDASQWAYLICTAEKWREEDVADANRSFGKSGLAVDYAWWRLDPDRFTGIRRRLTMTKNEMRKERGEL